MMIALGTCRFDPEELRLFDRHGQPIHLRRKSAQTLSVLARSPGRLVSRDQIIAEVWNRAVVSDESLSQCITDIRRGLGDTERKIVETVAGRGFILHADARPAPQPGRLPTVMVDVAAIAPADTAAGDLAREIEQEILKALSRRRGVRIAPASRNEVEVDYRISGSVRSAGNRMTAFLQIDEIDGRGIFFTEAFELTEDRRDVFASRVARKITNVQRVSAIAHFGARLLHVPDTELDLQGLLQKAGYFYARITPEDTEAAQRVLATAVERFPSSPMALAMLAATYVHMYPLTRIDRSPERVSEALDLADRAVFAGPDVDYVLRTRGNLRFWLLRDLEAAQADIRRAMTITPNFQLAHLTLVQMELFGGEIDPALQRMQQHIEVDIALPQYHYFQTLLAVAALAQGDLETARIHAREAHDVAPWSDWGILVLAAVLGEDAPQGGGTLGTRIAGCELSADHFADIPIRDGSLLDLMTSRARLAGL
ncbi:hypothetical protein HKCCE3408_06985 [Rhodobacterales bacterium HKCCE3408]|nr:hypothetical protein [Rhodobacterales bacterium HKCCE3408]